MSGPVSDDDGLYHQAVEIVLRGKTYSASNLQHLLQIGFRKAAALIDRMESNGILGPPNVDGQREVLDGSQTDNAMQHQIRLNRYVAACTAIAEAKAVDEVLEIRDRADALRAYAHQAKNKQLEIDASEIRFRAERRVGEMMAEQRDTIGLAVGGRPAIHPPETGSKADPVFQREASELPATAPLRPTLAEAGIDKALADRARKYAAIPADEFEDLLSDRRHRIERENARITVDLIAAGDKAEKRAAREAALAARIQALPEKRYGVILADPEWAFEPWSMETGQDRAAANHYPVSSLAALCARDVGSIAADDCLLALWATVPMLAEAFAVLDAWGFSRFDRDPETGHLTLDKRRARYVSSGSWTKYRPGAGIGMGHWFRVDHEILLLATRGHMPGPAPGSQARSIFDVPASRVHSQKPELVLEILEGYFPTTPKIELNRRGPARPGWDAWGNEAEGAGHEVAA